MLIFNTHLKCSVNKIFNKGKLRNFKNSSTLYTEGYKTSLNEIRPRKTSSVH